MVRHKQISGARNKWEGEIKGLYNKQEQILDSAKQ